MSFRNLFTRSQPPKRTKSTKLYGINTLQKPKVTIDVPNVMLQRGKRLSLIRG
jgi:hypothetical protein